MLDQDSNKTKISPWSTSARPWTDFFRIKLLQSLWNLLLIYNSSDYLKEKTFLETEYFPKSI